MARVKGGVHTKKKHKSVMARAKGFRGARSRRFKVAKEAVMHAERYAYRDRRARKGDFRRLWITRINAAARMDGLSYSRFMHGLKLAEVEVDRKNLADLAVREPEGFSALVAVAKQALDGHDGVSGNGSSPSDDEAAATTTEPAAEATDIDDEVEATASADTDEAVDEEAVDEAETEDPVDSEDEEE